MTPSSDGPRLHTEILEVPWKVVTTVMSVTVLAVGAMYLGHDTLAGTAMGAVVGYLGKLNGVSDGG